MMNRFKNLPLIAIGLSAVISFAAQGKEEGKVLSHPAPVSVELPVAGSMAPAPQAPYVPITITVKENSCLVENHPASNYSLKIHEFIKQEIKAQPKGSKPYILIAAPATHAMGPISLAVRESVRAGVLDIYFATKLTARDPNQIQFFSSIRLPKMTLKKEEFSALAPMFISVDKKSTVLINTGPEQEALDLDPNRRDLPLLGQRFFGYRAAATAGGKKAIIELYCDSDAPYQRLIDILESFERHKMQHIDFKNFKPKKRSYRNPYDKRLPRPLPRRPK